MAPAAQTKSPKFGVASRKKFVTLQDEAMGPLLSPADGAAAGECLLAYIGCSAQGKENKWASNATTDVDEKQDRENRGKNKHNQKRKARSRQSEVESSSLAQAIFEEKDAKNTRTMYDGDEKCLSADGVSDNMSKEYCADAIEKLESNCRSERNEQLTFITVACNMRELALNRHGTRVAQKALEVATGSDRDALIAALRDHVVELYESPHGNYVLSKAVEVLPRNKITFIVSALLGRGIAVAKHRFGCRVVCRLIEHLSEQELGELLDEFVAEAESLARHQFGNFAIQSLLEHATSQRTALLERLHQCIPQLAQHRTGSLVVQRLLDYCDLEGRSRVIQALLRHPLEHNKCMLVEVACTLYGSFVVAQLASVKVNYCEVRDHLQMDVAQLQNSVHAQRVIDAFKLSTIESD